jgi:Tfp pilus assembly protein PilX
VDKRAGPGAPKLRIGRKAKDTTARQRATEAAENRLRVADASIASAAGKGRQSTTAAPVAAESYVAQLNTIIASMRGTLASVETTLVARGQAAIRGEVRDGWGIFFFFAFCVADSAPLL